MNRQSARKFQIHVIQQLCYKLIDILFLKSWTIQTIIKWMNRMWADETTDNIFDWRELHNLRSRGGFNHESEAKRL